MLIYGQVPTENQWVFVKRNHILWQQILFIHTFAYRLVGLLSFFLNFSAPFMFIALDCEISDRLCCRNARGLFSFKWKRHSILRPDTYCLYYFWMTITVGILQSYNWLQRPGDERNRQGYQLLYLYVLFTHGTTRYNRLSEISLFIRCSAMNFIVECIWMVFSLLCWKKENKTNVCQETRVYGALSTHLRMKMRTV